MVVFRRRSVSLLTFLYGITLVTAATSIEASAASQEAELPKVEIPQGKTEETESIIDEEREARTEEETNEENSETETTTEEEEESRVYDPHVAVLIWLKNRATYAEENHYRQPWKFYVEGEDDEHEDYYYQNGYYFAKRYVNLLSGYNNNDGLDDSDGGDQAGDESAEQTLPRLVAAQDIPKGELLVGVPSNTFVYKRLTPSYKMLHPCDVASKILNARTYRYPSNGEEEEFGIFSLEKFVRPFLDSVLSLHELEKTEDFANEQRHLWTVEQIESLTKILGNELDPKANTMVLWANDGSNNTTANATTESETNDFPTLCQHPNIRDRESNKIVEHFFNSSNPRAKEYQQLFRSTVRTAVTRSWNHRVVPIYHWIPRSDDSNVVHSEIDADESETTPKYDAEREWNKDDEDENQIPSVYQLHASRDIKKGETIVLPYHSVAQKFAIEGRIGRYDETENGEEKEDTSYRFWVQTLHDQWGTDFMYGKSPAEPYDHYLYWDYFPKTQDIVWEEKMDDLENTVPQQVLRATQRNVLQAQYIRLQGMEEEVRGLLASNPNDAGTRAIVEYYDLWVESLGLVLATSRPKRATKAQSECMARLGRSEDAETCSLVGASTTSIYDDLKEPFDGDPIDYNRFVVSHDCTNNFVQTTYEDEKTPHARLEWTRSYIGGGHIEDHREDPEREAADEREQDTCLHLENVLHSCLAFRPHVHETLIHYPASFLPKNGMKRVLYVGGGDLVLLHELLRYKEIELVIGMELDQKVLRDSFRHYGIQPKLEDERVQWWFGDASKSLTLLSSEEYFGTFDMVLIDLVVEIFDGLKVGVHNERLVDYMMKLLKPEGILVRQEDWPLHNTVDFAKYTVDLDVFGMPHTCAQYFTMASNTVDFSNHERVDHELEDLVWYEPNIENHNHTMIWGEYRNNVDPPERICKEAEKKSSNVIPSNGLFVAIEAENVTQDLGDLSVLQTTMTTALEDLGFSGISRHDISVDQISFSSMMFVFEEGYLAIRSFPEEKFSSMDLQLWNDISKREIAVSTLVGAIGGDSTADSTTTFQITTGGMFGISNIDDHSAPMVASEWCKADSSSKGDHTLTGTESIKDLGIVVEEILKQFVDKDGSVTLILCPEGSSRCRAKEDVNYGPESQVITFQACPEISSEDESSLKECEEIMHNAISKVLPPSPVKSGRIRAVVIDPEVPREIGQIVAKIFVTDPSSFHWLSHDFVVLSPSVSEAATSSETYSLSWRYQLLERFRTDMIEFNPVYHSTVTFHKTPSSPSEWTMGILSAGDFRFYEHLVETLNVLRGMKNTDFEEVVLLSTKTGAISHIPDYLPYKWATPSDYDQEPAQKQYSEQQPIGNQLLVQHEKIPPTPNDINAGDKVIFFRGENDKWVGGAIKDVYMEAGVMKYVTVSEADESRILIRSHLMKHNYGDDATPVDEKEDAFPFGAMVMAIDLNEDSDEIYYYPAQIMGRHKDGRYKVYFLGDGSFSYLKPTQMVMNTVGFESSSDARLFSSCDEFHRNLSWLVHPNSDFLFRKEIAMGNGCFLAVAWPRTGKGGVSTLVATYDGQIHMDLNLYSSQDIHEMDEEESKVSLLENGGFYDTGRTQTDHHPRGFGRVVNFRHDLDKPGFRTKYPRPT